MRDPIVESPKRDKNIKGSVKKDTRIYLSTLLLIFVPLVDHVFVRGLVLVELVLVLLCLGDCLSVGPGDLVALLLPCLVLPQEAAVHQAQRFAGAPKHVLLLVTEFVHFILQRKYI